jgi:DNA-binding LacI/PurR family transcriptional regulator
MIQLTLSGIIAQASIHDWRCELIHHVQSEAEKPEFVDKIVRLGFDGVIWLGPLITHKINIMRLIDKKIPVIIDARPFPDIPVKVVLPDHADLAKKIAQFCKEKQFSRIAMLTSPLEGLIADPLSIDIVHHVREALSTTDITLGEDDVCAAYNLEHNVAKLVTKDFFMRHSDIEVIISLHDPMLSLVEQCLKEGVIFKDSLKLIINVFGIFHLTDSKIASIPLINFFRPAENIGKVLVQEFERLWLGKTDADILDLTVRVGSPV